MTFWDKEPVILLSSFSVGINCCACTFQSLFVSPSETLLQNAKIFPWKWLSSGDCIWVRDGGMDSLLLSTVRIHLVQTCAGLCAFPLSVSSDVCPSWGSRYSFFPWCSLHPSWLLYSFLSGFPEHSGLSNPKFLILCIIQRCGSLYWFPPAQEKTCMTMAKPGTGLWEWKNVIWLLNFC